jgi:hypothetical protein
MLNHFRSIIQDSRIAQEYDVLTQVEKPILCGHTQPCLYVLPVHRQASTPEFLVGLDLLNPKDEIIQYLPNAVTRTLKRATFYDTGYSHQISAGIKVGGGLVLGGDPNELAKLARFIVGTDKPGQTKAAAEILCDILQEDLIARGFDPFNL